MYPSFDYKTAQLCLEERIREAQEDHASQRRQLQQLSHATNWLGTRLIVWSQRFPTQSPTLHLYSRHIR